MDRLSPLERAVLFAVSLRAPPLAKVLDLQLATALVASRENTGVGFRTIFQVFAGPPVEGVRSPMGGVGARIRGLKHGVDFQLWLRAGRLHRLEGCARGEDTAAIDFARAVFGEVGPVDSEPS